MNKIALCSLLFVFCTSGTFAATARPTITTAARMPTIGIIGANVAPAVRNLGADTNTNNPGTDTPSTNDNGCRDAYRACMDEFCLLDEAEGARCACSANITQSKSLIQEIQKIQQDADDLFTTGVEREGYGTQAKLIFGESAAAQKVSRASGLSLTAWLSGAGSQSLDTDADIGDTLYSMAYGACGDVLAKCGATSEMEELLYSRQIVNDCKNFNTYLAEQKTAAEQNKRLAEAAVRAARVKMFASEVSTEKYNRGECLIAYRGCVSDKGGCGVNFENCLDAKLLQRRANACTNILDQCASVREYVIADWAAESKSILADAERYADRNRRQTCFAQIQLCIEDGCGTATNTACLTNVNVAAGICPIIDECNAIIPGIKTATNAQLADLRIRFCQNDIYKCLQDKCGVNYDTPECIGKKTTEIAALCPQEMFSSCRNEQFFDVIMQSAFLDMDYNMTAGCINYYAELLGRTCGTDMECLPTDSAIANLTAVPGNISVFRDTVTENTEQSVNEFFKQFEKDATIAACRDSQKVAGRKSLKQSVFDSAKMIATVSAQSRAMRALDLKIAELTRNGDIETARQTCLTTFRVERPDTKQKAYTYISSVSFEPSLRNCHVCRVQRGFEAGGESKGTSGLKAAAGGLATGAAAGTMITPGWGTAIGAVVGGVGGFFAGHASGGIEEFPFEIESCEDINM